MFRQTLTTIAIVMLFTVISASSQAAVAIIADHTVIDDFDSIPGTIIQAISTQYLGYYAHTSHGSQIMTGLTMLEAENALLAPPYIYEDGGDLGHVGDTSWVPACRTYLDGHTGTNLVMFSWCGGCSDNTEEGINIYLNKMAELEGDYPDRSFIYMTGHLDGTGPTGNLYVRNEQIRSYCVANNKILFDFADIESYAPNGTYYPDGSDACEWCYTWCDTNSCPTCSDCAHSHCFNCYLKGKAWWWMMAQLASTDTCYCTTDCNDDGVSLSVADMVYLSQFVEGYGPPPVQLWQGDLTGDGYIDHMDVLLYQAYLDSGLAVFPEFPIPTTCNPDTTCGSCCAPDGSDCRTLAEYRCLEMSWDYLGDGTSCSADSCPSPATGACCDSALNCYQATQADCQNLGNDYTGDDVSCDPAPCGVSCCAIVGDVTHDTDGPNIADLIFLVQFMFQDGPEPVCLAETDINGNGAGPDIEDLIYLVTFMFQDGPAPVACD